MPSKDVLVRTQQLIDFLKQLGNQSGLTAEQLEKLEIEINKLQLVDPRSLSESVRLLLNFRENLRAVGVDSIGVYNATQYYVALERAIAAANIQAERYKALGEAGAAQRSINRLVYSQGANQWTPGMGYDEAEVARLEKIRNDALSRARNLTAFEPTKLGASKQMYADIAQYVEKRGTAEAKANAEFAKNVTLAKELVQVQKEMDAYFTKWQQNPWGMKWGGEQAASLRSRVTEIKQSITGMGPGHEVDTTAAEEANIMKATGPFTSEALQRDVGLSAIAADNLNKKLGELGMTEGKVLHASTELSTGITTVSMALEKDGQVTQTYTAHLGRTGEILQDTQRRFRSFGSAVMRDVVEVLKWTIAIGAIYGPIRKLGELLQQMKDIQLALVDVEIVLGSGTEGLKIAFEAASKVATETSSSIVGVIQGYALAAGAAASADTEFGRLVATESLLRNSMILSKLSGLDQKTSLDTLVGAISQAGVALTDGSKLLDSWVAVSKQANVSVNQMATTFSIVGSAAQEVGINFDQLNAMVGAMAQSTNLSADEIGNAIRGIIAAMQTDKAAAEFAKYGIATKTLNGDMRDLLEVLRELKVMQQAGILDEKAMGALMQAGGAGARRGAQLSALVKSLGTVMNLVSVSEQASGDAAKAMALELETLDAAATRLNNAFAELAQTLGGEGGMLDFLTSMTKAATSLVGGLRELVSVMKWAAPVFATFLFARGVAGTSTGTNLLGTAIPKSLQMLLTSPDFTGKTAIGKPLFGRYIGGTSVGADVLRKLQERNLGVQNLGAGFYAPATMGSVLGGIGNILTRPLLPQQYLYQSQMAQRTQALGFQGMGGFSIPNIFKNVNWASLIGPAVIAATNIGRERGAERTLAGGVGALPGILMGNPMWATIGSIIATGFYDKFLTFEGQMAQSWLQWVTENPQVPPVGTQPTWTEELLGGMKEALTGQPVLKPTEALEEKTLPTLDEQLEKLTQSIMDTMTPWDRFKVSLSQLSATGLTPEQKQGGMGEILKEDALTLLAMYTAQKQGKTIFGGKAFGVDLLSPEIMQQIEDMLNTFMLKSVEKGIASTEVETARTAEVKALADLASTASADLMQKALMGITEGASGAMDEFSAAMQISKNLQQTAGTLVEAQQRTPGMPTVTGAQAITLAAGMTAEETTKLITAASDITSGLAQLSIVTDEINDKKAKGIAIDDALIQKEKDLNEQINSARQLYPQLYAAMVQRVLSRQVEEKIKPTIEVPAGISREQLIEAARKADAAWRKWLEINTGASKEAIDAYIATVKAQYLEAEGQITDITIKAPQKFLNLQFEEMGLGQIPNLEDWRDRTKADFQAGMAAYKVAVPALQKMFPGWQPAEEKTAFIFKDGFDMVDVDLSILNMLMRDLIDVEKEKGLQGMYNLPAGATFYVPVTAYELHRQTQAEIAGGGAMSGTVALLQQILDFLKTNMPTEETQKTQQQSEAQAHRQDVIERERRLAEKEQITVPPKLQQQTTYLPLVQFPETLLQQQLKEFTAPENQPKPEQPTFLPSWLQGVEEIGPAINRLYDLINKLLAPENFDIGVPNPTTYAPTERAPMTTALNLAVDQKVTLTVDGRTLATIIKPYLYQDLIKFNTSTTTSTSKSVIA